MREVLPELMRWWRAGETVGVGTVVATFRSAPAAARCVDAGRPGRRGGRLGVRRLRRGRGLRARPGGGRAPATPVLQRYGVSDDDAFAVGLTCGGILDVYVEKVDQRHVPRARRDRRRRRGRPAGGGRHRRRAPRPGLGRPAARRTPRGRRDASRSGLARHAPAPTPPSPTTRAACSPPGTTRRSTYGPDGERRGEGMRVFVWSFAPPPRMLVFGAIDFAAAVARMGNFLGYQVTVCDARPVFATELALPVGRRGRRRSGRTSTSRRGRGRAASTSAPCSACSPTTRSSTCRCSRWRCGCPRSPTSGRWARGAPTTTGWPGCGGRAHRRRAGPAVLARSASTSAPAPRRRPRSASRRRSSRCAGAARASGSRQLEGRIHH